MKPIMVTDEVHKRIKHVAKEHGFKLGDLADRVIENWLNGEVFFLPEGLRRGKATKEVGR